MDNGDRVVLEEVKQLNKNLKVSPSGLKFSGRGSRNRWTDHNTDPVGFKSGCNSIEMYNQLEEVCLIDSDEEEDVKKKTVETVLISSDEENCNKDTISGSSKKCNEQMKLSFKNISQSEGSGFSSNSNVSVKNKNPILNNILRSVPKHLNPDKDMGKISPTLPGAVLHKYLLSQDTETHQMLDFQKSKVIKKENPDSSKSGIISNVSNSQSFSKVNQTNPHARANFFQGIMPDRMKKNESISPSDVGKRIEIKLPSNSSNPTPNLSKATGVPLITVRKNLEQIKEPNINSGVELVQNIPCTKPSNFEAAHISFKTLPGGECQTSKPLAGMNSSQAFNFHKDISLHPSQTVILAKVQEPMVDTPLIENSVAINVKNSLPASAPKPIAINLCIPASLISGTSGVRGPVSSSITNNFQVPNYPSARLVILQPSPNETLGNLSINPMNNFQTSPQMSNSNLNPQIVVMQSLPNSSGHITMPSTTLTSSKESQAKQLTVDSAMKALSSASNSRDRLVSLNLIKPGGQRTLDNFIKKSPSTPKSPSTQQNKLSHIRVPSFPENAGPFLRLYSHDGHGEYLSPTKVTSDTHSNQESPNFVVRTSAPGRSQAEKVNISEILKVPKFGQTNNQVRSENNNFNQITARDLQSKHSESVIIPQLFHDSYPRSGQFEMNLAGSGFSSSQISWKVVGRNTGEDKRNTSRSDIVVVNDSSDEDQGDGGSFENSSVTLTRSVSPKAPISFQSQKPPGGPEYVAAADAGGRISVGIDSSFEHSCGHSSLEVKFNFERSKDETVGNLSSMDIVKEEYDNQTDHLSTSLHTSYQFNKHTENSEFNNSKTMLDAKGTADDQCSIKQEIKSDCHDFPDETFTLKIPGSHTIGGEEYVKNEIKPHSAPVNSVDCNEQNDTDKNEGMHQEHNGDKPFECPHCGFSVAMERNLEMHIKSFHSGKKPILAPGSKKKQPQSGKSDAVVIDTKVFHCTECNFCTHRSSNLTKHLVLEHNLHCCHKCSFVVDNPHDLKHHENTHKKIRCSLCCVMFFTKDYYDHLGTEHQILYKFKCDFCDFRAISEWKYRSHLTNEHKDKLDSKNDFEYQCEKCSFKTGDESNWTQHKATHTERCRFICFCGFRAVSEASLASHTSLEHPKERNPLECVHCFFIAESRSELSEHKYTTHPEKFPYFCKECPFRACKQKDLTYHIKLTHMVIEDSNQEKESSTLQENICETDDSGEGPCKTPKSDNLYLCDHCPYTSTRKCKLQIHMYSHADFNLSIGDFKAKFKCKHCNFESDKMKVVSKHSYETHVDILNFSCKMCIFRTASLYRLERHERNVHKIKNQRFKCNACKFKTDQRYILLLHKQKTHQSKCTLKCSYCSYRASTSSCLRKHCKVTHRNKILGAIVKDTKKKNYVNKYFGKNFRAKNVIDCAEDIESDTSFYHCGTCDYKNPFLKSFQRHNITVHSKYLECTNCLFVAESLDKLFSHKSEVHSKIYRYRCSHCSFCSTFERVIQNHEKDIHDPIECYYCAFSSTTSLVLKQHIQSCHPEMYPLECDKCGYQTLKKMFMALHKEQKHMGWKCSICSFSCESSSELYLHTCSVHSHEVPYHCDKCTFKTNNPELLNTHEELEHIMKCKHCEFLADTHAVLNLHIYQCHPSKYILHCLTCSYMADKYESLAFHELNVHNMRSFRCRACFYSVDSIDLLSKHISKCHRLPLNTKNSVHSEKNKFPPRGPKTCQICKFTSDSSAQLYKHFGTSHPDEYPWKCSKCCYRAKRSDILHVHERLKHNKIRYITCKFCDFKAEKRIKLVEHTFSVHGDKFSYHCDSCSYKSTKKLALRDHMACVHHRTINENAFFPPTSIKSEAVLQCSECDFYTLRKRSIKRHIHVQHSKIRNFKKRKFCSDKSSPDNSSKFNCINSSQSFNSDSTIKIEKCDRFTCDGQSVPSEQSENSELSYLSEPLKVDILSSANQLSADSAFKEESLSSNVKSEVNCASSSSQNFSSDPSPTEMKVCDSVTCDVKSTSKGQSENTGDTNSEPLKTCASSVAVDQLLHIDCSFKVDGNEINMDQQLLICSLCLFSTSKECELISHGKEVHNSSALHKSDWCSYTSYDLPSLINHVNARHHEEAKCPSCPFKSVYRGALQSHKTLEHP